jgi:hypothetical protein
MAMRWTCTRSLVLIAFVLFQGSVVAQTSPRACLSLPNDPTGALPRKDVDNVIYRMVWFDRSDRKYEAETFSDTALAGADRCFRWEAVNSSKSDPSKANTVIDEFTWPAGFIGAQHMEAGDGKRLWNIRRDNLDAAQQSNPVYAFEHGEQITQSWVTSSPKLPDSERKGLKYEVTPSGQVQKAAGIFDAPNPNALLTVIYIVNGGDFPPEIQQDVGIGRVMISIRSSVGPHDRLLSVTIRAAVTNPPEGEARYGFPGLVALEQSRPKEVGNSADAAKFLNAFREAAQNPQSRRESNVNLDVAPDRDGNFSIYRVLQPVAIITGESRYCYLVATYSPVPIGFTLQDCWAKNK